MIGAPARARLSPAGPRHIVAAEPGIPGQQTAQIAGEGQMNKAMLLAACASAALGGAGAAMAQARSTAEVTTVGQLVVTAEKREEKLETVPVAVSAYTSKERDVIGVETIQDLTNFTPGLEYST